MQQCYPYGFAANSRPDYRESSEKTENGWEYLQQPVERLNYAKSPVFSGFSRASLRRFGTTRSQVQILSPRLTFPDEYPSVPNELRLAPLGRPNATSPAAPPSFS